MVEFQWTKQLKSELIDTQTPGGTSRFSLKLGAVQRYYITAEHCSAFRGLKKHCTRKEIQFKHANLHVTRIDKDEKAVAAVYQVVQGWMNHFAERQDLLSLISTARTVSQGSV